MVAFVGDGLHACQLLLLIRKAPRSRVVHSEYHSPAYAFPSLGVFTGVNNWSSMTWGMSRLAKLVLKFYRIYPPSPFINNANNLYFWVVRKTERLILMTIVSAVFLSHRRVLCFLPFHPWLPPAFPEITELSCRPMNHGERVHLIRR